MIKMKQFLGCFGTLIVLIILTTYLTISSLNPFDVYVSGSVLAKVLVSLLGAMLVTGMLGLVQQSLLRIFVRGATGAPAEDARCPAPDCGLPLLPYISSHGPPIICSNCHRPWHLRCFKKEPAVELPSNYRFPKRFCPDCEVKFAKAQRRDLYKWLGKID